jgi:hypothetical protein
MQPDPSFGAGSGEGVRDFRLLLQARANGTSLIPIASRRMHVLGQSVMNVSKPSSVHACVRGAPIVLGSSFRAPTAAVIDTRDVVQFSE